jgi:hypothetical protein
VRKTPESLLNRANRLRLWQAAQEVLARVWGRRTAGKPQHGLNSKNHSHAAKVHFTPKHIKKPCRGSLPFRGVSSNGTESWFKIKLLVGKSLHRASHALTWIIILKKFFGGERKL